MNKKEQINFKIKKISFTHRAIKRFKKEKDKIREKEIIDELRFLILNGIDNSYQERTMNKFNGFELIDYLEHHKKQRIILFENKKDDILVIDVLFDHLGRDELDYKRYWEGEENIDFKEYLVLDEDKIYEIFINKNYDKFLNLI